MLAARGGGNRGHGHRRCDGSARNNNGPCMRRFMWRRRRCPGGTARRGPGGTALRTPLRTVLLFASPLPSLLTSLKASQCSARGIHGRGNCHWLNYKRVAVHAPKLRAHCAGCSICVSACGVSCWDFWVYERRNRPRNTIRPAGREMGQGGGARTVSICSMSLTDLQTPWLLVGVMKYRTFIRTWCG